ncbi:anaerobic C4-dicarboxylate transporter family protein [Vibrio chagasii]|nr:anaerobic C4-dicarboxylate transporter family protein [Vibrio chagasii]
MIAVELFIVLLFIFLGARIGGIGIGFAGGAGVIALSLILGVPTSQSFIPIDVCILIIMSVIHCNRCNAGCWRYGLVGTNCRKLFA